MAEQRPLTLATLAPVVFSLFLGGIIGVEVHKYALSTERPAAVGGAPGSGGMGGGGGGMMGGGGGGGRGGGGGNQPNSGRSLSRLVASLSTIEKIQGKGLTADQDKKLLPLLQSIKSAEKLPEKDAKAQLDALQAVLTPDQTQAIADMTPQRGGGRGGGGAPGSGGGRGGAPGSGAPGSGGAGGGGQPDPDKPFASDRSKKALDDLIGAVSHPAGK